MSLAFLTHDKSLRDYMNAKNHYEKRAIAVTYFEQDAAIVNAEMKKKLEEERK